jgi:hypothetical protein
MSGNVYDELKERGFVAMLTRNVQQRASPRPSRPNRRLSSEKRNFQA